MVTHNTHQLLSQQAEALTLHAGGGRREEPAEHSSECSLQAVSMATIQLLGYPNRRLPIMCYIYDQKIYGELLSSEMKAGKRAQTFCLLTEQKRSDVA